MRVLRVRRRAIVGGDGAGASADSATIVACLRFVPAASGSVSDARDEGGGSADGGMIVTGVSVAADAATALVAGKVNAAPPLTSATSFEFGAVR